MSVSTPTMRTSSAASKRSAMRCIRSPSASQSRRHAPKRKSANAAVVIPASCASAGVGYMHATHLISSFRIRGSTGRIASRSSAWRSGDTSVPSLAFSGANTTMSASIVSQNVSVERRQLAQERLGRGGSPGRLAGQERLRHGDARQRVGAAPGDQPQQLDE